MGMKLPRYSRLWLNLLICQAPCRLISLMAITGRIKLMKSGFLYFLLVGIPILGIWGTLRFGENLRPPVSVGGTWRIELSSQAGADASCGQPPIRSDQPVLTISQSGPHLLLTFNDPKKTSLIGEIHAMTITAELPGHSPIAVADASDEDAATTYLEASVDRQAEPNRLRGVLTFTQCSLRTRLPFTALRQHDGDE